VVSTRIWIIRAIICLPPIARQEGRRGKGRKELLKMDATGIE
jgi:hypothetical protein